MFLVGAYVAAVVWGVGRVILGMRVGSEEESGGGEG